MFKLCLLLQIAQPLNLYKRHIILKITKKMIYTYVLEIMLNIHFRHFERESEI